MRKHLFGAVVAVLLATPAGADPAADLERMRTRVNQLSEDWITCTAFFMITAQGTENHGEPEDLKLAAELRQQATMAMLLAQTVARKIGQKPEVATVRLQTIAKSLMQKMGGDFINYSLLADEYLTGCVELMRDPVQTVSKRLGIHARPDAPGERQ